MSLGEIHVGDTGTIIEVTLKEGTNAVNLVTATIKRIILHRPDHTLLTRAAIFSTTGADGKIRYVTVAGDLSMAGNWALQTYIEMPSGRWHSDIFDFVVYPNL